VLYVDPVVLSAVCAGQVKGRIQVDRLSPVWCWLVDGRRTDIDVPLELERRASEVSQRDRRPPAPPAPAFGIVGFLLFPPDRWETAADMPIQLTLLQGGSSAFRTGPIAP
jgi:hypothetical protein